MKKFKNSEVDKSVKIVGGLFGWRRTVNKTDTDGDGRWDIKSIVWSKGGNWRSLRVVSRF